jgi:tRNA threonylcarbamoyladenosine biosynthesis protein TsaE
LDAVIFKYFETDLPHVIPDFLKANKHKIITFQGEMGVGKTTFIKELCKNLGVTGNTSSPTFSLVNEYEIANNQKIYHFDFYRIKSETEALDMGIDDYFDSGNWCFIEWPEKISNLLNLPHSKVEILILEDGARKLILTKK